MARKLLHIIVPGNEAPAASDVADLEKIFKHIPADLAVVITREGVATNTLSFEQHGNIHHVLHVTAGTDSWKPSPEERSAIAAKFSAANLPDTDVIVTIPCFASVIDPAGDWDDINDDDED